MKNYLLFPVLCCFLITFLQSCKDEDTPCCEGYSLNVAAHWTMLEEGRNKPSNMSALVYSLESSDYLRTSIHPDGGNLYSDAPQNNLLLYNIKEGDNVTFQNLSDYGSAEAILIPYEEDNELFIKEPYLLYGESFNNQSFETAPKTLHFTPVALTHLIRFDILTVGEELENITACHGQLSGLSSRVKLSSKTSDGKGYPTKFATTQTTTNYIKELYHFGYVDNNILELTFDFSEGESKSVQLDLTDTLKAIARQNLTCRLTVVFNSSGVHLAIKDVVIEPYKIGDTEFVEIS